MPVTASVGSKAGTRHLTSAAPRPAAGGAKISTACATEYRPPPVRNNAASHRPAHATSQHGRFFANHQAFFTKTLATAITDLRCRRAELAVQLETADDQGRDVDLDLDQIRDCIEEVFSRDEADRPAYKALLRELVEEVRVDSRQAIHPTFRVPTRTPVRIVSGLVGGGAGNRTRVLRRRERASPGAACCVLLSPNGHAGVPLRRAQLLLGVPVNPAAGSIGEPPADARS
jgi:hypothetical protein